MSRNINAWVLTLVARGRWSPGSSKSLAEKVFFWNYSFYNDFFSFLKRNFPHSLPSATSTKKKIPATVVAVRLRLFRLRLLRLLRIINDEMNIAEWQCSGGEKNDKQYLIKAFIKHVQEWKKLHKFEDTNFMEISWWFN